jgi:hypothetical protein
MGLVVVLSLLASDPVSSTSQPIVSQDTWHFESTNFVVRSRLARGRADQAAKECEAISRQLCEDICGPKGIDGWKPKCEVILHASQSSYLDAVGPAGTQTVGSSTIRISEGRTLERRIDLLVQDPDSVLAAFPHEFIHVLFAERFPHALPPRWAEEGIALLRDPQDKQSRHGDDLRRAIETGSTIPLSRLFTQADYLTGAQRATFYAQSMSVAEYLTQLDDPKKFVTFVDLCMTSGHDRALQTVYRIPSIDHLERQWIRHVVDSGAKSSSVVDGKATARK